MEKEKDEKFHTKDVIVAENYLFSKFLLSDKLLKSLNEMNYFKPSPIQLKTIPLAKSRLDLIIQSKSGTGKTLAFSMCLLESYDENLTFPQALVIVPTREIAVQITNILNGLGKYMKYFKACEFIGGTDLKNDRKRIQTTKIVVGTPGRILHLIKNEIFNTTNVKAIVFDEADKLFEAGHLGKDVQSIFKSLDKKNLQIIAATATVTTQFETEIKRNMKNPIGITPKQEVPILLGIKQFAIELPQENDNIQLMRNKVAELGKIFTRVTFKQCLLFTDSQSKTESYGNYLNKAGWKNEIINGSQEQSQRLKVLNKLTKFKCRILITTDLLARGIDIDNVNLIINLDLPYDCFTYLHRIGRAGRFGTHGIAITVLNGEKDSIKFKSMLTDIGSSESMVWNFPNDTYNFWDFNNLDQNNKLTKFDAVSNDQNGNIVVINGNSKAENDIVDENLMLLELTRKLVDQKTEKDINKYELDTLLKDYEEASSNCNVNGNGKLDDLLAEYEGVNRNKYEESCKEKSAEEDNNIENVQMSCELSDVDVLLKEYERTCQNYENHVEIKNENDNNKEVPLNGSMDIPIISHSPKEKPCIIYVRNEKGDDEYLTDSESSESECEDDVTEDESITDEESEDENQQENFREFAQLNHNNEYRLYNNYVMENYLQWRRTFYFQIANIQNFVNHNREDLF